MNREHLQELTSCPMMSQIVVNRERSPWTHAGCDDLLQGNEGSLETFVERAFDWEESPQGDTYWRDWCDGEVDLPDFSMWERDSWWED